mgnify:FL=1
MNKVLFVLMLTAVLAFANIADCEKLTLIGKLYLVGNVPFLKLVLETKENDKFYLEGNMLSELKRLQHTTVKVNGHQKDSLVQGHPPVFWVDSYQIISIGEGENLKIPWVGTLKAKGDNLILLSELGKQYKITGNVVTEFKKHIGAKIWVTGTLEQGWFWKPATINGDAYQIIRKHPTKIK